MTIGENIEEYDYNRRYRNLDREAKSVIKSEKFFPVFLNNGKEEIFKPLSKTKPFTTPFFAYSEVFWSNVINKYFDKNAPIYRLALCKNYSKNVEKYYDKGTIVPSLLENRQTLVNFYEYFMNNKDDNVDISYYVNYCMTFYDYKDIFNSKVIRENQQLGENLALQVLISILEANQNFHYENVNFIYEDDNMVKLASPIDHEFSTMFLFLDDEVKNQYAVSDYLKKISIEANDNLSIKEKILIDLHILSTPIPKELDLIIDRYPNTVYKFLEGLELFIDDLEKEKIIFVDSSYMEPFNSQNYKIGMALYKNHNEEAAKLLIEETIQKEVDLEKLSTLVTNNTLLVANTLKSDLYKRLEKNKLKEKRF